MQAGQLTPSQHSKDTGGTEFCAAGVFVSGFWDISYTVIYSEKEIVTEMTAQGLLAANGKPLTYNTIRNMLHNRRYIGAYSFRETVLPDCVPAIVPRDLFDRVQERLELEIAEEKIGKPLLTPKFVHSWVQRFRKLDPKLPSHRKTLIDNFLNVVILFDDKLILSFNYREGTETITFADLNQADVPTFSAGSDIETVASPKILHA